jgi:hypothetical protein
VPFAKNKKDASSYRCSAARAAAWPLATRAQQGEQMRRIGVLMGVADDPEGQTRVAAIGRGRPWDVSLLVASLSWPSSRSDFEIEPIERAIDTVETGQSYPR